jgi:methionyl-tRNA synthetase
MSKSVGNVVDPFALVEAFGVDPVRFFFLREVPFGNDGNYSHEAIVNRINADLANDLGNLAQRSLSMIFKNLDGKIGQKGAYSDADNAILAKVDALLPKVRAAMDKQQIHLALNAIWGVVGDANRYFAGEEPWALKNSDPARMAAVLYVTAEIVRQVAILSQPVMPESAAKLLDLLQIPDGCRDFSALGEGGRWPVDTIIKKPEAVFPRYVEAENS